MMKDCRQIFATHKSSIRKDSVKQIWDSMDSSICYISTMHLQQRATNNIKYLITSVNWGIRYRAVPLGLVDAKAVGQANPAAGQPQPS